MSVARRSIELFGGARTSAVRNFCIFFVNSFGLYCVPKNVDVFPNTEGTFSFDSWIIGIFRLIFSCSLVPDRVLSLLWNVKSCELSLLIFELDDPIG